jgi:hypothetical protein
MQIDFPGKMTPFTEVQPAELFVYFGAVDDPSFAMKIFDAVAAEKPVAVMCFSTPVHPSMTPPTILEASNFENRDVLVLQGAELRPTFEVGRLRRGLPSANQPGPVIFAEGATFIRAWAKNSTVDVDLRSGAGDVTRRQGGACVEDWKIVLKRASGELVLCERGKPAAARTAA